MLWWAICLLALCQEWTRAGVGSLECTVRGWMFVCCWWGWLAAVVDGWSAMVDEASSNVVRVSDYVVVCVDWQHRTSVTAGVMLKKPFQLRKSSAPMMSVDDTQSCTIRFLDDSEPMTIAFKVCACVALDSYCLPRPACMIVVWRSPYWKQARRNILVSGGYKFVRTLYNLVVKVVCLKFWHKPHLWLGGAGGTSPELGGTMYPAVPIVPTPLIGNNSAMHFNRAF